MGEGSWYIASFLHQVKDYDAISRIDPWMTAQLLHIKKKITAEPDIN